LGVISSSPNNARAQPTADAAYSLFVSVSLGATVIAAPHTMQWYRRTSST
jgi:hypothetical protein